MDTIEKKYTDNYLHEYKLDFLQQIVNEILYNKKESRYDTYSMAFFIYNLCLSEFISRINYIDVAKKIFFNEKVFRSLDTMKDIELRSDNWTTRKTEILAIFYVTCTIFRKTLNANAVDFNMNLNDPTSTIGDFKVFDIFRKKENGLHKFLFDISKTTCIDKDGNIEHCD